MPKTWIFIDFDNTMMATEKYAVPTLITRFNELYGHLINKPLTYEIFKENFHGQARENLCDNLGHYFDIEVDYKTLYENREWHLMQHLQSINGGIEMAPHLLETLTGLASLNIGLALVSNNPIQRALTAMRFASNNNGDELANLFGTSFFEAGEAQKPKPDVYLRAMSQLEANSTLSFAIEDSVSGVKSATAAGLTTFGFTGFSSHPEQEDVLLLKAGCVATFNHWQWFPSLLENAIAKKSYQKPRINI